MLITLWKANPNWRKNLENMGCKKHPISDVALRHARSKVSEVWYKEDSNGCFNCVYPKPASAKSYPTGHVNGYSGPLYRVIYEINYGALHLGLIDLDDHSSVKNANTVIRHKCDNKLCLNPNHYEPGTDRDNFLDYFTRGRYRKLVDVTYYQNIYESAMSPRTLD